MQRVDTPATHAGDGSQIAVRFVFAEVDLRFGRKVPPDLDTVLRYYLGVHSSLLRAARQVLAMAKTYGIEGAER